MLLPALAAATVAFAPAPGPAQPPSCSARLKAAEDARDLAQVKLEEETERADAQAYLIRLELRTTKQQLAAALARCGAACAAPTPPLGR